MPGGWIHLAERFLWSVRAGPLTASEQAEAARLMSTSEAAAFFEQPAVDQRHGLEAARYVSARAPQRSDLIRAALLHDIGKRHARLGTAGRVAASLIIKLGLPIRGRVAVYHRHGPLAAAELAGSEQLVVAYARWHHEKRPPEIDATDWDLLCHADGVVGLGRSAGYPAAD